MTYHLTEAKDSTQGRQQIDTKIQTTKTTPKTIPKMTPIPSPTAFETTPRSCFLLISSRQIAAEIISVKIKIVPAFILLGVLFSFLVPPLVNEFLTPIDLTEKLAHFKMSRIKSMYIVTKSKDIQKNSSNDSR